VTWIRDLSMLPSLAVALTAGLLIVMDDRRHTLLVLAVQYVFSAWLSALALPPGVAAVKLVAGLVATGILWVSLADRGWRRPDEEGGALPAGHAFRWIAVLLVALVSFAIGKDGWGVIPSLAPAAALGAMLLFGLGVLQLGITEDTLRVGTGILTVLCGFETAYAAVEPSIAVVALLASVHVGIALVISYLLVGVGPTAAGEGDLG
jgi:hypothetical protein